MHDYHADAPDRIAVQDALDIIGGFVRDGLPLITWEIHPHPGRISLDGHVGTITGHGSPAEVRDTVQEFAEWFGVRRQERRGREQDSTRAATKIRDIEVEVWGVIARHEGGAR